MKLTLNKQGGPQADPDANDRWSIAVFGTGKDGDRMTLVGPYRGLGNVQRRREALVKGGMKCVLVRMMHSLDFEDSLRREDLEHFGFAARIDEEAQTTDWHTLKSREKKERARQSA